MGAAQDGLDQDAGGSTGDSPRRASCSRPADGPPPPAAGSLANGACGATGPLGANGACSAPAGEPLSQFAQLAAADERERLSRDLHDLVLQRLFGLAASLTALSSNTSDERAAERLRICVSDLDQTIDAIRDGILHQPTLAGESDRPRSCPPAAVVALAEAVVAEAAPASSQVASVRPNGLR